MLLYFDIDACQLAYDGSTVLATPANPSPNPNPSPSPSPSPTPNPSPNQVLATPAARRALTSGVNVADATCRSSSYEQVSDSNPVANPNPNPIPNPNPNPNQLFVALPELF